MKDWIDTVTSSISHATFYLHCLHKSARSYVTCFASSHEGTNFGLKNHSIPMKANASLTTTAKVLAMQANLKTADLDQSAYRNMVKKSKKMVGFANFNNLVTYAGGLLHAMMDRDGLYEAKRVGNREFEVTCNVILEPFLSNPIINQSPIPCFSCT